MKRAIKSLLQSAGIEEKVGRCLVIAREKVYDIKHGTNTGGNVQLRNLKISSPNAAYGCYYEGFDPNVFTLIANDLHIEHREFQFVDFGSGKGRVLLMASEYPFRKITGVEFSQELHGIAEQNIRRYRSATQQCKNLESICMDAMAFPIPSGPVVLFFCNPFGPEVLGPVVNNIQRAIEETTREVYVVYAHPRHEHLMDNNPALKRVAEGTWHIIYKGFRS